MKCTILATGLVLAFTAQLYADVTIISTSSGKGSGLSAKMVTTTYIMGLRMRVDTISGDKTLTTIYDVPSQKMYTFDSKKKEADAWDMTAFAQSVFRTTRLHDIKSSIMPNGQTKLIGGKTADGYDVTVSVSTGPTGSSGTYMTTRLNSHAWVVKDAPGTADYAAFYKAAADKGWTTFQDPKSVRAVPGQAWAIAKMYEQFATLGGVPYQSDMTSRSVGRVGSEPTPGAPHGVSAQQTVFDRSLTSTTQSIDTGNLSADVFMPPAGYKLKVKR